MLLSKKEKLIDDITIFVTKHNADNKVFDKFCVELHDRMSISKATGIFNTDIPSDMLSELDLYFVCKALYNSTSEESINPKHYFSEIEIKTAENKPLPIKDISDNNTITISNVYKTEDDFFTCVSISSKELYNFLDKGMITYNFETQRGSKKIERDGNIAEKPILYKKAVRSIKNLMVKGKYRPTEITFNIVNNGESLDDYYNEKEHTLTIVKDASIQINVIDGYHRLMAINSAIQEYPDLEQVMKLNLLHYDVNQAQEYILQQAHQNPISKQVLKTFDTSNATMIMAKDINKYESENTNLLFDKLGRDINDVEKMGKYCTMEVFSQSIIDNFSLKKKDIRNQKNIKKFLVEFFNELLINFEDRYSNVLDNAKNVRKELVILHNNAFAGYIAIASQLYETDNWEEQLVKLTQNVDWSISNPLWKENRVFVDNFNKPTRVSVYNAFKNLLNVD